MSLQRRRASSGGARLTVGPNIGLTELGFGRASEREGRGRQEPKRHLPSRSELAMPISRGATPRCGADVPDTSVSALYRSRTCVPTIPSRFRRLVQSRCCRYWYDRRPRGEEEGDASAAAGQPQELTIVANSRRVRGEVSWRVRALSESGVPPRIVGRAQAEFQELFGMPGGGSVHFGGRSGVTGRPTLSKFGQRRPTSLVGRPTFGQRCPNLQACPLPSVTTTER